MKNETMKKKFSYKDILYKSKRLTALCLIGIFAVGIAVTSNADNEIPVHDGDVLVDSLSVSEDEDNSENKSQTGGFKELRAEIELDRNKLLASLDSTINSTQSEDEKNNASSQKERILGYTEKELSCENQIKSKNLPDSLVVISENGIRVTVDKQELDTNTVAKICDIVMRETGKTADKIVIQSKY